MDELMHRIAALAAKEGPLDVVGHFVVATASVAWALAAIDRRRRRRSSTPHVAIAAFLALVLLEELDLSLDLHNAWRGHAWPIFALFAALPFVVVHVSVGMRERLGPNAPRWSDTITFGIIGSIAVASTGGAWEEPADELAELALYALLLVLATRREPWHRREV